VVVTAEPWADASRPCGDPECAERGGIAEPESDGDVSYYACTTCGYVSDYERIGQPSGDGCQLGIPEAVRRAASPPQRQDGPVFVGTIGRRPQ
jgi:hypothetical protein